jgi:hypothetical protein
LEAVAVRDRRSRLIRLCLFAALAVAAFAILTGNARAAFTPAAPPVDTISNADPTTIFTGTVLGTVPDGGACEFVPSLGTCSYFELETVDAGRVEVAIRWPAAINPVMGANLDLYVFECTGREMLTGVPTGCTQIAVSMRDRGSVEFVEFEADAGGLYQIRVVPFFVLLAETYEGCAGYDPSGDPEFDACGNPVPTEDEEPPPPPPADFFACANTMGKTTGGGYISDLAGSGKAHFAVNAIVKSLEEIDGKVNFHDDSVDLRLWGSDLVCYEQAGQTSEVRGRGDVVVDENGRLNSRPACFVSRHGDANPDSYEIEIYELNMDGSCDEGALVYENGPKPVVGGNLKVHV